MNLSEMKQLLTYGSVKYVEYFTKHKYVKYYIKMFIIDYFSDGKKKKNKRPYTKIQPDRSNVETVDYQKLVVPKRMHSPYWKYFGFPASDSGVIITQDRIICILCKKQFAYKSNTTNLKVHLQSRHKTELMVLEMGSSKDGSLKKKHVKNELMLLATSEGQVDIKKSNNKGKQHDVYVQGEINENFVGVNNTNVNEQTPQDLLFQDIDNSVSYMPRFQL